jgi:hypothetical protein
MTLEILQGGKEVVGRTDSVRFGFFAVSGL